jgi:hypothetical protein
MSQPTGEPGRCVAPRGFMHSGPEWDTRRLISTVHRQDRTFHRAVATVAAARRPVATDSRARAPWWARCGLDIVLLAASAAVFWATGLTDYTLVLAPEGVAQISVSYWAFAGPPCCGSVPGCSRGASPNCCCAAASSARFCDRSPAPSRPRWPRH